MITNTRGDLLCGATVDGGVLAESVMISNNESCGFTDIFDILSDLPNRGERKKGVVIPYGGVALDDNVRLEHAACTDVNIRTNHTEGTNFNSLCDVGRRVDDRRWVDQ